MSLFYLRIVLCGLVRTPGPVVQCVFYRSLIQQENDGSVDQYGHLCVPSHELFSPYIAKTPSCDQKITASALQCGLPTTPAEPGSKHRHFTSPLTFLDFHNYCRLPYLCLLAQAQWESVPKFPLASQFVYHFFCSLTSSHGPAVTVLESATESRAMSQLYGNGHKGKTNSFPLKREQVAKTGHQQE